MYENYKIKLIFMVINGCKYSEWHLFNLNCEKYLTAREYSNIKKNKEYKILSSHFNKI